MDQSPLCKGGTKGGFVLTRLYNRIEEKAKRRKLRNDMTIAEKLLWERIRRRQIRNKRFLRQFSIGKYVLDFYCPELKLAIEVDGDVHHSNEEMKYDKNRKTEIEFFGIQFLRFDNKEIFTRLDKVIMKITSMIDETPNNLPLYKRGKI